MTDTLDSPFDDVRDLLRQSPDVLVDSTSQRITLGRLDTIARVIAATQTQDRPTIDKPTVALFAGSHGLAHRGVSVSAPDATDKRVASLREGKSPTSGLAGQVGATVRIFELALDVPTVDIAEGPAMSEKDCAATIAYGMEALTEQPDCLALGVLGVGGGTAAAAVACGLYGGDARYWVRAGGRVPNDVNDRRASLVSEAINVHRGHLSDPLSTLQRLGGRELAACVGAIIAARHQGVPVILDGFATAVAAGVVHAMDPRGIDHVFAGQVTDRPAHKAILERIGKPPLLDLELELGEGVGSALAINILRSACAIDYVTD